MLALPVAGRSRHAFIAGRISYQLGRISVYTVLGLVAGAIGQTLLLAGVQRWVSLTLGLVLLAGLLISPQWIEFPWLVLWISRLKRTMAQFLQRRSLASLAALGGLNGLLPCGLVYAAFAAASATSQAVEGATYMFVFGLGTAPTMLGISLSGRLVPTAIRLRLRHLAPVTMGLVGGLLVLRGLALGIPYLSPDLGGSKPACCHPANHSSTRSVPP